METAAAPPHVLVLATRLKGEVNCAPFTGLVTVIANAGTQDAASAKRAEREIFISLPRTGTRKLE
jgi:hypothetical protein